MKDTLIFGELEHAPNADGTAKLILNIIISDF